MMAKIFLVIFAIVVPSLQDSSNNQIDDVISEAKADILKEQTMNNVGGLINNFMNSEGAKQLGDILASAGSGEKAGEILQGLGSVISQGKGLDPGLLSTVLEMMQGKKSDELDMTDLTQLFGNVFGGQAPNANLWEYLPMMLQTANAFLGPEAEARAKEHQGHVDLLPPIVERIHLWIDHFVNSEMGTNIIQTIGAEKFVRVFADDTGKLSYQRFVQMLENHSFRKHWIRLITNKIAATVSFFSDRKTQKRFLSTFQHFLNGVLKSQGYPKRTFFDQNRPTETLSALVNYFTQEALHMKVDSKEYVQPFVNYIGEIFQLAGSRGMLDVNSHQLSDKLADTINLDVIEPIARVNRGYKFAKKAPICDKYVMCLVNQHLEDIPSTLPALKTLLSKSTSLVMSWFLSSTASTTYWDFYTAINEDGSCQKYYFDVCHDFHLEEIKVKEEYVHNEL